MNNEYFNIGHGEMPAQSWILPRDMDNISYSKLNFGKNLGFFHYQGHLRNSVDCSGRIDHKNRKISIITNCYELERTKYAMSVLKLDFPNYSILEFKSYDC